MVASSILVAGGVNFFVTEVLAERLSRARASTTLADLLTPLLVANPFSTMRASLRRPQPPNVQRRKNRVSVRSTSPAARALGSSSRTRQHRQARGRGYRQRRGTYVRYRPDVRHAACGALLPALR